jgi:anti-sigma-K factor RskA
MVFNIKQDFREYMDRLRQLAYGPFYTEQENDMPAPEVKITIMDSAEVQAALKEAHDRLEAAKEQIDNQCNNFREIMLALGMPVFATNNGAFPISSIVPAINALKQQNQDMRNGVSMNDVAFDVDYLHCKIVAKRNFMEAATKEV